MDKPKIAQSTSLQINKTVFHRVDDSKRPSVRDFLERELGCQFSRADRHGEIFGACCFHRSKSGKSFSANVQTGLWFCHGCGFGGDLYSFVRRRYGFSFIDAARYLGTLEDGPPVEVPTVEVPYLACDFRIAGKSYRAQVLDEPRTYLAKIRQFYHGAGARLTQLGLGKSESDEGENCWARLALGLTELREAECS
jgi:CHC2 zinc finger